MIIICSKNIFCSILNRFCSISASHEALFQIPDLQVLNIFELNFLEILSIATIVSIRSARLSCVPLVASDQRSSDRLASPRIRVRSQLSAFSHQPSALTLLLEVLPAHTLSPHSLSPLSQRTPSYIVLSALSRLSRPQTHHP